MLDANASQSSEALIEGIWGELTPQHPEAALQIAVSRLRAAMGPAGSRIVSRAGSYALVADDDELDLLTAQRLYAAGQEALEHGDATHAAAALDGALRCWSGEALVDVGDPQFCDDAKRDLHELRLAIYEARNDAYLLAGRHVEVLADIDIWVRAEPWRERLREQQMIALYRAGRQVDALAIYEELRVLLRDQLGLEPSEGVREVHAAVLQQDPSLRSSHIGSENALPRWTVSTLPFVGRGAEDERITEAFRRIASGGARCVLVEGEAGIGKSRLTLQLGRRLQDQAVVVAMSGNDTLRPAVDAMAIALVEATSAMSDTELRHCLGHWPGDLAFLVPELRERFPDLPAALTADPESVTQRLRAALASWIAAISQRAPVALLVDDLHLSGPGMLMLLDALFAEPDPKRLLVLANARSGEADGSGRLDELAAELDRHDLLVRVPLTGLDVGAIRRLLTHLGRGDDPDLPPALHRLTAGHPFLLSEVLHDSVPASEIAGAPIPEHAAAFVLRRARSYGPAMTRVLGIAALIDQPFDVAFLAELGDGSTGSVTALVDQAVAAGFLRIDGVASFAFVHELSRHALAASIGERDQAELHRRIAVAMETRQLPAAWIAAHWSRARGDDVPARTRKWAGAAGDDAMRLSDPGGACRWFELAVEASDDARTHARFLIRLADAQWQSGEGNHIDSLTEALHIARELNDPQLLVEAASVWSPVWSAMPALHRKARIALLREASASARDDAVRGQLLARLSAEILMTSESGQARSLCEEALACARRSGNSTVLPEVLMRHFYVAHTPHMLLERQRNIAEALTITDERSDHLGRFFALGMAATAAIEGGQLERADTFLETAYDVADRLQLPMVMFNVMAHRAWRTGLRGDLAEAEAYAIAAGQTAQRHGVEDSQLGTLLQVGCIRWHQERLVEILPALHSIPRGRGHGLNIVVARALVESADKKGEAAEYLRRAAQRDFAGIALDVFWSTALIFAAEIAFAVEDAESARVIQRLLAPFADQVAFVGNWVVAPIAYGAAIAAAAAGEDAADGLFEHAIAMAERLRAPLLRARAETAWGKALLARGATPRKQTLTLVDRARSTYLEHGIDGGVQVADQLHLAAVGEPVPLRRRKPEAS
jgi:DNA-binding SARP family transcriptional activator